MSAKKPSKKSNKMQGDSTLNLTPFIDMITCLMFFLMMFAGIIPVVIIDAPLPKVASTAAEVQKAKEDQKKIEITVLVNTNDLVLKATGQAQKTYVKSADGKFPYKDLHTDLIALKERDPKTTDMTIIPGDDTIYDTIIQIMDAARDIQAGDKIFQNLSPEIAKNVEGAQFNRLFPDVSIGGI